MKTKIKLLIEAFWKTAISSLIMLGFLFIAFKTFGTRSNNNWNGMGGAPDKWESISFKEAWEELSIILPNTLIACFLFFLLGFEALLIQHKKCVIFDKKIEECKKNGQEFVVVDNVCIPLSDNVSYRPVPAIYITKNIYKLQGKEQYEQLNEEWQFLPGDTVVVEWQLIGNIRSLVAIEKVPKSYCVNNPTSEINAT